MNRMAAPVLVVVSLLLGVVAVLFSSANDTQTQISATEKPTVYSLWVDINNERKKAGKHPLALDTALNASAKVKAMEMITEGDYSHTNEAGKEGYEYIVEHKHGCLGVSENLNNKADSHTSKDTVKSWMNSTSHREAILNDDFDIVGYAVEGEYVVQHFCDLP